MASSLVVMGLEDRGSTRFCYAAVRPARGAVDYPAPSLTVGAKEAAAKGTVWPLDRRGLSLRIWNTRLEGTAESILHSDLDQGRLALPAGCPFDAGTILSGPRFGPLPVPEEDSSPGRCAGAGLLRLDGFAIGGGGEAMVSAIQHAVGDAAAGEAIERLCRAVAEHAGAGKPFPGERRLAVVDRLRRAFGEDGPRLFSVALDKPSIDSTEPARRIVLRRQSACRCGEPFRLALEARHLGTLVSSVLLELEGGVPEIRHDAGAHVTNISLAVYDARGELVEAFSTAFCQTIGGSLTLASGSDPLPPIRGAVDSPDLEQRARITTGRMAGISVGERAEGLDVVRANARVLDRMAGRRDWTGAVRWFENSANNQADVVRYLKLLLEDPDVERAVLADPYLGRDAFERVVVRQGRQDLELTILVSPANVDPDSEDLDAPGAEGAHIRKLRASLESFADRTCGELRLIHLRRGEGSKQAFHDRYLLLYGPDGAPRAFLLSNSLNEAAGKWPYALAEFDRPNAWAVAGYVDGLLAGRDRDRTLAVETLWPLAEPEPVSAGVAEHLALLAWLAADSVPDDPTDRSGDREAQLRAWLAGQAWAGESPDTAAHQAYAQLVARRWRESNFASPDEIVPQLAALAAFEAATGLSSTSALGPLLEETPTSEVVANAIASLVSAEPGGSDHLRGDSDLLFGSGPIQPATGSAALRSHRRFEPGRDEHLLALLLQLDPIAFDAALMDPAVPPRLRQAAMGAAMHLCFVCSREDLAARLEEARSPGLRMLSMLAFDRELQVWVPRPGLSARLSGEETITVRAAEVTASLVRASGVMMQHVPDTEFEEEQARRDAAHSQSIEEMAADWPADADPADAAALAWAGVWERLETGGRLADALRRHGQEEAARQLDRIAARHVLAALLPQSGSADCFLPNALSSWSCAGELRRAGRSLAALEAQPTNFVRERLNPLIAGWTDALEAEILTDEDAGSAVRAALAVSVIAIQIAVSATNSDIRHRAGLAADYVRLIARAVRTDASAGLILEDSPDGILLDAVADVLAEAGALTGIDGAIDQVAGDPDISRSLKARLRLPTDGG